MFQIYYLIFYQPILNILVFLYDTVAFHDFGLAIIFSTILIRLLLFPVFHQSVRQQTVMQKLQPQIKKIQEIHKKDLEKQSRAMMDLYKEHKVNPLSGFLLILVQIPILIALYRIFLSPLSNSSFVSLYSFVKTPTFFTYTFLGLTDLRKSSILIVGLAALAQFFQTKLAMPAPGKSSLPAAQERITRSMVFLGPILTFIIFLRLPAAVSLYWLVSSLFSVGQQIIVNKKLGLN